MSSFQKATLQERPNVRIRDPLNNVKHPENGASKPPRHIDEERIFDSRRGVALESQIAGTFNLI